MISFKGRHKDKVFMPSKPTRIGFKAFVVCESDTGFLLEWKMYNKDQGKKKKILNTVKSLLSFSRYQSKAVYMDRYYSNKGVFMELLKKEIYACGTMDPSRVGITEEMRLEIENLQNEKAIFYIDDRLLLCVWRTRKEKLVSILLSLIDNSIQNSQRFCIEKKEMIPIKRPAILEAYNQNMQGVDYFDRHIRYYSFLNGSKKCYQKIAYYFLEVAILSSYTIYEKECGEENALNRKQYIISIIYSLLDMRKENSYTVSKLDCGLILQEQPRNCTACNAPNKNRKRRLIFIVLSVLVMFVLSTVLMSIEK